MNLADICHVAEHPAHDPEIDRLTDEAFGPGRFTRAAQKIREGGPHDRALSFVALHSGAVVGSVRMTPVAAGGGRAHMLGPLVVDGSMRGLGLGRRLLFMAVEAARRAASPAVLLVGDAPYYGPLGFSRVSEGRIVMPRPVDPARLLVCELRSGGAAALAGALVHARGAGAFSVPRDTMWSRAPEAAAPARRSQPEAVLG